MIAKRGVLHRAFLRGRSTQNIRMERGWRDVRKDTLQFFREIFLHLEEIGLLDMESSIDRLSREKAINRGYWTSDPGDDVATASDPSYGVDSNEPLPPLDELAKDPDTLDTSEFADAAAEQDAEVYVNHDEEVEEMRTALGDIDYMADDGNWGIDAYCRAVLVATEYFTGMH
ncbi:hypothetical protein C8R47DRAFT_1200291 [Mycena vitilis]|nr:hypothetical protein C8R47DRAFT_1200291 [Mycena vitilis]